MQRHLGIIRNKTERMVSLKREAIRKKNRFQIVGKEQDDYEVNSTHHPTQPTP